MLHILSFVEILPLIRCLEEGITVIKVKMIVMKLHHSIQSYLAIINHEQSLIHSLDMARQNFDTNVAFLCSILSVALLQLRRRVPIIKSDIGFLLDQCQSYEVLLSHLFVSTFCRNLFDNIVARIIL
jgi:hypothetical protein